MASVAPLKICHKGEIHRFYMDMDANSFDLLMELFHSTFHLREGSFVVQYTDAEGDVITMTNEVEYRTALEAFKLEDGKFKTVRFSAVSRNQVVFQENVADPILKAIEKLVETLNAAMEKVKHEDWKLRAQTGVDYTNEALKNAAKDARESLNSARQSIQEIPFDQMLKETTEGIKAAAEGISIFAKEVAEEMKKEKLVQDAAEGIKTAAERVSVFAKDAVEELKNLQIPQGMPMGFMPTPVPVYTETAVNTTEPAPAQEEEVVAAEVVEVAQSAPVSADSDWEQVAEQTTPAVEEEIVEVVVSEEEKKWADQLSTIRDIFPNVDTIRAIERLEEAKGNVEIVLNALMEEM